MFRLISVLPVLWQERDRQHIMCWETGRFLLLRIKESRKLISEFLKEAGLRMNKGRSSAMKWKFSLKSHRNLNVLKTAKTFLIRTREFWVEKTTDPALADKTILVSSHGCAVRALLQNVYQDPEHFWHGCVPPNCSINLLEVKDGKARFLEEDKVYYEI